MKRVSVRGGASAIPEESIDHLTHDLVTASGVLDLANNDWLVSEHSPQNMSVDVAAGRGYFKKTAVTYHGVSDAVENLAIGSNSSGNPRIDAIAIYVDIAAIPNADASNVLKFMVVAGTPASSPTAPIDSAIQTAVGAGNPFLRLAEVRVESGASSIVAGKITDKRAGVTWRNLGSVSLVRDRIRASSNISLTTTTITDIPGATVTLNLAEDSYVDVFSIFDVQATVSGAVFKGFLNVDGVDQTDPAFYRSNSNNERMMVAMTWGLTLPAGTHIIKLRGQNQTGSGQFDVTGGSTGFTYLVTSQ